MQNDLQKIIEQSLGFDVDKFYKTIGKEFFGAFANDKGKSEMTVEYTVTSNNKGLYRLRITINDEPWFDVSGKNEEECASKIILQICNNYVLVPKESLEPVGKKFNATTKQQPTRMLH